MKKSSKKFIKIIKVWVSILEISTIKLSISITTLFNSLWKFEKIVAVEKLRI